MIWNGKLVDYLMHIVKVAVTSNRGYNEKFYIIERSVPSKENQVKKITWTPYYIH